MYSLSTKLVFLPTTFESIKRSPTIARIRLDELDLISMTFLSIGQPFL